MKAPKIGIDSTVIADVRDGRKRESTIMSAIRIVDKIRLGRLIRRALIKEDKTFFSDKNARVQCTIIAKEPRLTLQSKLYTDECIFRSDRAHYFGFVITRVLFAYPHFSSS